MPRIHIEAPPPTPGKSSYDPRATLEKILKPLEAYQQRRDQALAALRAGPEEQETRFCWGGPGQFTLDDVAPDINVSISIRIKDKDKDKPQEKKTLEWNEKGREFKKIRVENPDDPSQYVVIHRIETITFSPPGEEIKNWTKHDHKFTLHHPEGRSKNPPGGNV